MVDSEARRVRTRMIDGATQILARRGLQGTAFSEVLALAGASRGSVYHHFPGGKNELIDAVLARYTEDIDQQLRALAGASATDFCEAVLALVRGALLRYDCEAGNPLVAATIAADTTRIQERCRTSFKVLDERLREGFARGGLDAASAAAMATFTLAAIEGARVLCRAQGSIEPFDTMAAQLRARVAQLAAQA